LLEAISLKNYSLKIVVILILFINSNLAVAQEWRNLNSYQKETNNKSLHAGCWLKKDRKNKSEIWNQANTYNLSLINGFEKYKTIKEIRDFYKWFDKKRIQQRHEIQWIGIAAIATNQLAKLEMNFYRIFIVRNKEVVQFASEGSKKVFSDAFPKLKKIYFSNEVLVGEKAKEWDKNHGFNEQCKLLQPFYDNLSKKAFNKLKRMAKAKGVFCFAIPKKLKFEGNIKDCEARVAYGIEKLLPIYLEKHNK